MTSDLDELAQGIAIVLLAEWIAIENNETRLQAMKYMDEAQGLADWLKVIGYELGSRRKLAEEIKNRIIDIKRAGTVTMNCHAGVSPHDKQSKKEWEVRLNALDEIIGVVMQVADTNSGRAILDKLKGEK